MKLKVFTLISIVVIGIVVLALTTDNKVNEKFQNVLRGTDYDVIVIGGEPEGVAAAVSAARNGARVLFVEHRDGLGGLITYGMLNYLDLPQNANGELTSLGIFKEWWNLVGGPHVTTVDIEESKAAFLKLVENEKNIDLKLNTTVDTINMLGKEIQSIVLSDGKTYTAKQYIDTTADADFAVAAGASYTTGQQDFGVDLKMAVTLMIHLKDVDWAKVKQAGKDGILGGAEVTDYAAWGFGRVLHEYDEKEENTQVRGLNIGRTKNQDVFINALQIFYVDGLSEDQKAAAIEEGKRETDAFLAWLKVNLPGFENAKIASYPSELYVRETRHINSPYRLTIADVWESAGKSDVIAYGSYPVDVQATEKGNYGNVLTSPHQYAIPYRSLLSVDLDNVLVASKASGYDSLAAGSSRIIPTGMSVAEAAGIIATYAVDNDKKLYDLIGDINFIKHVQQTIIDQGGYLTPVEETYQFHYKEDPIYPSLKILYSYELISGGYKNDFNLERTFTEASFNRIMKNGFQRLMPEKYELQKEVFDQISKTINKDDELTSARFNELLSAMMGEEVNYDFNSDILTARDIYPIIASIFEPHIETYKINNENQ